MELIAKLFGLGIILCVTDIILCKSDKKDVAFWLGLAGLAVAMALVVPLIGKLFKDVQIMFNF